MGSQLGEALPYLAPCIYLDYNATTMVYPEVAAAMLPFLQTQFGNPSSIHTYGQQTKAAVVKARRQVAALINADPAEIYFTSCGTESDNWALTGAVMTHFSNKQQPAQLPHVVTSSIEHPAILACLDGLQQKGFCTYTAVPVDQQGLVSPADVEAAMTPHTVLVTIMHSNNEVGSIQPIAEIASIVRNKGALMHTDAAQSTGKVQLDVQALGVDMMTIVGHKFGAPKGIAALYIRHGVNICNLFYGGGQEQGRRAGTENVLLITGLGAAAELARQQLHATAEHMAAMRDQLQVLLTEAFGAEHVRINGPADPQLRLPNTLSISIPGVIASQLLQDLKEQLAASAAAACHSGSGPTVSATLAAMEVSKDAALGTLRLSTGRHTTAEELERAVKVIKEAAAKQGVQPLS